MPPIEPKGRDLFILDNGASGWTGLRCLEEWAGIAAAARQCGTATAGCTAG